METEIEEVEVKIRLPRVALEWMEKFAIYEDVGIDKYLVSDLLNSLRSRIDSDELAEMSYAEFLGPKMIAVFARHNMLDDLDPTLKRKLGSIGQSAIDEKSEP